MNKKTKERRESSVEVLVYIIIKPKMMFWNVQTRDILLLFTSDEFWVFSPLVLASLVSR